MTHFETWSPSRKILMLYRHKGLLHRVAERCRVHPSLVSRVFHGKARSARVQMELERQLSRLAARPAARRPSTASGARLKRPIDRSRELRWLTEHSKEYAGRWVALDGGCLIADGVDAKAVFAAARRSGSPRPLFLRVEPSAALPFGGW